jgi:ATP-dependent Lon protease, bacterial type
MNNKSKFNKKERLKSIDLQLLFLCASGDASLESVQQLVKKGASATVIHPESGKAAIHYAAKMNDPDLALDIVSFFVKENEINPDTEDSNGMTPLFYASLFDNIETVTFLIEDGISNVNHIDKQGETALFTILETFDDDVARILLDAGADVTIINKQSESVLSKVKAESIYSGILPIIEEYTLINSEKAVITLYDKDKIDETIDRMIGSESPVLPYLEDLRSTGNQRIMGDVNKETISKLELLKTRFPNFSEVIDYINEMISLSLLAEKPYFSIRPLLMHGGSGVGKTRFTKELASAIGIDMVKIDGGTISGGFVISGSNPIWKESKPGKVCEQLKFGKYGNPIIMLDEIDKMQSQQGFDPYGPLYPLLEAETAMHFTDDFLGVPMNCSRLIWIATANELNNIPAPILSRFSVIKVRDPNQEEMPKIVQSVYDDIINDKLNSWGACFSKKLNNDIISVLKNHTPREIRSRILTAMGKVAMIRQKEKISLSKKDIIELNKIDFESSNIGRKTIMGFR